MENQPHEESKTNHAPMQPPNQGQQVQFIASGSRKQEEDEEMLDPNTETMGIHAIEEEDDDLENLSAKKIKENASRDYKCTFCAKTYLSYPALYTHLKNKHAKGPDGNPTA